jgi:uncharacterized membrane protein YraQ (UPF0718 family)
MVGLWIVTGAALLASLVADRRKTRGALVRAAKMLAAILGPLLGMLALVSLTLAALPADKLEVLFTGSPAGSFVGALLVGSVALIPGFVAYPLAGLLREHGASTATLGAFVTTLMMVGVLSLPVEARMFGWRLALQRNGLAFVGAILVAGGMAWVLA